LIDVAVGGDAELQIRSPIMPVDQPIFVMLISAMDQAVKLYSITRVSLYGKLQNHIYNGFFYLDNTNSTTITRPSTITTTARTTTNVVTTEPSSSKCYDCSGSDCGREGSSMSNCPKCIVYRNPTDQSKISRIIVKFFYILYN
jgi:hypothetical protein